MGLFLESFFSILVFEKNRKIKGLIAAVLAGCADLFDGDEEAVRFGDQQNTSDADPKTVIVVGAGPAGMSAAILSGFSIYQKRA